MIKLHEIPIYALSEKELSKRYEHFKDSFWGNSPPIDAETFKRCIEHETHPQRGWNHNHVVGSIDVLLDKQDIVFEIYLPYPEVKRYDWRRSRKIYVRNIMANGTHFYIKSEMSNSDIQAQLSDMLNFIVKDHIPKHYYVDRRAFDAVSPYTDYKGIFDKQK